MTGADQLHAEQRLVRHTDTAVREVRMKPGHGQVDCLLYVDRKFAGVIEATPLGAPLSGVEWQSAMYTTGPTSQYHRHSLDPSSRDGRAHWPCDICGG